MCPHPGLRVSGYCYLCLKARAGLFNGQIKVDRLTQDQKAFIGLLTQPREPQWIQPNGNEQELESLQELLDTAPGWFALARRILESDKDKSKS